MSWWCSFLENLKENAESGNKLSEEKWEAIWQTYCTTRITVLKHKVTFIRSMDEPCHKTSRHMYVIINIHERTATYFLYSAKWLVSRCGINRHLQLDSLNLTELVKIECLVYNRTSTKDIQKIEEIYTLLAEMYR